MIDVLIVDDNPIVRSALRTFLAADPDIRVTGEAADGRTALTTAQRLRPAVTILDHRMPVADGLTIISRLAEHTAVLVVTSDDDPALIAGMLRGGARGYLVHGEFDPPELLRAVQAVAAGRGWMSPVVASVTISALRAQEEKEREQAGQGDRRRRYQESFALTRREEQIMELVCAGHANAAIGRRLLVTEKTVKNHLNNIYAKLGAANRTEAAMMWTKDAGSAGQ